MVSFTKLHFPDIFADIQKASLNDAIFLGGLCLSGKIFGGIFLREAQFRERLQSLVRW
jgi:hypothetical protein